MPTSPSVGVGDAEVRRLVADRGDAGQRLDLVLQRRLGDVPGVSRTRVQRWIDEGRVLVGGRRPSKASARPAFGDRIEVRLPPIKPRAVPAAERGEFVVLHEDADLLAVDKAAGVVAHPAYKHAQGTLLNALIWRGQHDDPPWTPRLVHRLDRQTSGVLLVAKSLEAHRRLSTAWKTPDVVKTYLAVVWGRPSRRRGEIDLRLDRDPVDTRRVLASKTRGRDSLTRYELITASRGVRAGVSLLTCELVTGRMHQVRAHLAAIGLPIVGDPVYGPARLSPSVGTRLASAVGALGRQALHAWTLRLAASGGATAVSISAPVPDDMRAVLAAAGIDVDEQLVRLASYGSLPVSR